MTLLASACASPIFASGDAGGDGGDVPDARPQLDAAEARDDGSSEDDGSNDDADLSRDADLSQDAAEPSDAGTRDDASNSDASEPVYPAGNPGCGLGAAAFCATFDDVATPGLGEGRSGELDPRDWSGARMQPGLNYGPAASPVRLATIPRCRSDLPGQVYPGQDALICSGNELLQSRHMLMAAAEQTQGQLSLRIRRPFDFAGRTGKVVFDAEGENINLELGWISIAITEQPSPAPSFGRSEGFENGALPRAGVEAHLFQTCGQADRVGVGQVSVFREHEETFYTDEEGGRSPTCVKTQPGTLNHFELLISRTRVELFGSDRATNGGEFGALKRLFSVAVNLSFERGYVHLTTHNHASLQASNDKVDAVISRWDNVGFDGPVISDLREYSVADANEEVSVDGAVCRNVGYQLGDMDEGPYQKLSFLAVDPAGMKSAQLALVAHLNMNNGTPYTDYALLYRVNGRPWQTFKFDAAQLAMLNGPLVYDASGQNIRTDRAGVAGAVSLSLPVDLASLVAGENALELVTSGVPNSYRPYVANVDLVLSPR
jgi:hypothetical protein